MAHRRHAGSHCDGRTCCWTASSPGWRGINMGAISSSCRLCINVDKCPVIAKYHYECSAYAVAVLLTSALHPPPPPRPARLRPFVHVAGGSSRKSLMQPNFVSKPKRDLCSRSQLHIERPHPPIIIAVATTPIAFKQSRLPVTDDPAPSRHAVEGQQSSAVT